LIGIYLVYNLQFPNYKHLIQKQAAQLTKMANTVLERIASAREEWENSERAGLPNTSSMADTQELVAALQYGKSLRSIPDVVGRIGQMRPQAPSAPQRKYQHYFSNSGDHTN
jgi:hypothetical protein